MRLKLNCYQLTVEDVLCKPHSNHKENTCRRYTIENQKRIKACLHKKKKINETQKMTASEIKRVRKATIYAENNKIEILSSLSVIILNVNILNSPTKIHNRMAG